MVALTSIGHQRLAHIVHRGTCSRKRHMVLPRNERHASPLECVPCDPLFSEGYQIVREGDDPEGRPAWAYPLGGWLIAYFSLHAILRMIAEGPRSYIREWRYDRGENISGNASTSLT